MPSPRYAGAVRVSLATGSRPKPPGSTQEAERSFERSEVDVQVARPLSVVPHIEYPQGRPARRAYTPEQQREASVIAARKWPARYTEASSIEGATRVNS